jgi:DeoR/GlpR family transcriptional regulator of sugar metabolism
MLNMKKLFILIPVVLSIFLASCGSSCEQADWIGTYDLVSEMDTCILDESTTVTFEQTLVVEAGATATTVSIDGTEAPIDEDNCSVTALFITLNKDGDDISSSFGADCNAIYRRR